jgi:hypothetical protein
MAQPHTGTPQASYSGWHWYALAIVALVGLGLWMQTQPTPAQIDAQQALLEAGPVETRGLAPAPHVRKGPQVVYKGQLVSSWLVTSAGDTSYNGTYVASGTYNGQPKYTNGSRWLWAVIGGAYWVLSPAANDADTENCYTSATGTLPGGSWSIPGPPSLTAPAPTLAEVADLPSVTYPIKYPISWYSGGPPLTPSTIAPCYCTIGGTAYVAIPHDTGIVFYNIAAGTWHNTPFAGSLFASYDLQETGALYDAGDDATLWGFSGVYNDSGWKYRCSVFTPTVGTGVVESSNDVVAAYTNMTPWVQTGNATFRAVCLDGADWKQLAYTGGGAAVSTVANYGAVNLPVGYIASHYPGTFGNRYCLSLYDAPNGDRYWFRGCGHYRAAYALSDTACERLSDRIAVGNYEYTTLGYFAAGIIVAETGTDPYGAATWTPGNDAVWRVPFAEPPMRRRWFIEGGTDLLMAGWTSDSFGDRPFVMTAAPYDFPAGVAKTHAAAYPVALWEKLYAAAAKASASAYPVTMLEIQHVNPGVAQVAATAYPVTLIESRNRSKSASNMDVEFVRVRHLT